ncbi:MAG: endonuclease III [Thaumarchaeota archaeon]|jgi:endonuclease-3|nr:endonuclease III [Candidatus Geocrenenecus arthurdayi]MCL7403571.1 endonuclease III [Candidatus Geocrenenecus arthurdayi]
MVTAEEFLEIIKILEDRYSIQLPEHVREDPFKILIGTILSQRTKDEITDKAYEALFRKYPSIQSLANASVREIEKLIKPVGFYRIKARRIKQVSKIILEKYSGVLPKNREELLKLPGVGDKTADIVLSFGYNLPEIAIDTHVETVVKRLGIAEEEDKYMEIKRKLEEITPIEKRSILNIIFVSLGKEVCRKPKPRCTICPINRFCKYYQKIHLGRES